MKNKFGWVQIIFTYIFLWISIIFGEKNKDIFFISYIAAIICMVDAKFKYNSVFIKNTKTVLCNLRDSIKEKLPTPVGNSLPPILLTAITTKANK